MIHAIAEHLTDLSNLLRGAGERDAIFPLPHGRGDEAKHGSGPDPRDALGRKPEGYLHSRSADRGCDQREDERLPLDPHIAFLA